MGTKAVTKSAAVRLTRFDGTPCDDRIVRGVVKRRSGLKRGLLEPDAQVEDLAAEFQQRGVSLPRVERAVLRLNPEVRPAISAHRRLELLKRQVAAWQNGGPMPAYYQANPKRPDAPYAWAIKQLSKERAEAWPRNRRQNALRSKLINTVVDSILQQLEPSFKHRDIEWGLQALSFQLAEKFLQLQYPFLSSSKAKKATADRIRRLPSRTKRS